MFLNNLADLDLCRSEDGTSLYNSARNGPLVLLDDIRVPNMLATWRRITLAKMDITSIGHCLALGIIRLVRYRLVREKWPRQHYCFLF